jgi:hypothetical protein
MSPVLGTIEGALVGDDVLQTDAGDVLDHFGGVDHLVDAGLAVWPGMTDGYALSDFDDLVAIREQRHDTQVNNLFLDRPAGKNVEIPNLIDPSPKQQGAAAKKRIVTQRQIEIDQVTYVRMHLPIVSRGKDVSDPTPGGSRRRSCNR